nr:hypothetical protein [Bacillus velezensis]
MTEYETCAQLAEAHFPLYKRTFSSLPPKNRRAAWAVLALFHEADRLDVQELEGFEQAAQDFLNGTGADGFLWEALADVRQSNLRLKKSRYVSLSPAKSLTEKK